MKKLGIVWCGLSVFMEMSLLAKISMRAIYRAGGSKNKILTVWHHISF